MCFITTEGVLKRAEKDIVCYGKGSSEKGWKSSLL